MTSPWWLEVFDNYNNDPIAADETNLAGFWAH